MSLGYSTLVLVFVILLNKIQRLKTSSWHIFAMTSIPGDLLMLSVFVAKVAVLSIQYFECSVLTRTDSEHLSHIASSCRACLLTVSKASRTS